MPSSRHEDIVEILRKNPETIAHLLGLVGVAIPDGAVPVPNDTNFNQCIPVEFRADLVVLFGEPEPWLAVVVESQLGVDDDKFYSWPVYLTVLRSRLRCKVLIVVIALDDAVRRWASRPIDLGNGSRVVPVVIGRGELPRVTEVEVARR